DSDAGVLGWTTSDRNADTVDYMEMEMELEDDDENSGIMGELRENILATLDYWLDNPYPDIPENPSPVVVLGETNPNRDESESHVSALADPDVAMDGTGRTGAAVAEGEREREEGSEETEDVDGGRESTPAMEIDGIGEEGDSDTESDPTL
ncbi:hypothetical protein KIPB_012816, partial [Kipferlia bialata]